MFGTRYVVRSTGEGCYVVSLIHFFARYARRTQVFQIRILFARYARVPNVIYTHKLRTVFHNENQFELLRTVSVRETPLGQVGAGTRYAGGE